MRQLLTESLLLAIGGSLLGLLFALWGMHYILLFLPAAAGELSLDIAPDSTMLCFTAVAALLSTLLFGLIPALRSTALDPAPALKEGASRASGQVPRLGLRKTLVVVQVALSVVLVVLAGLCARSLAGLRSLDPGFHNQNVITFTLDFPLAFKELEKDSFRQRLITRFSALPGVISASYGFPGPYQGGFWTGGIRVAGSERTAKTPAQVALQGVAPRYFETVGSPLVRGREFDQGDSVAARKVAVVNEAFVRQFFPIQEDVIGRTLSFDDSQPEGGRPTFIVGVARDMLHQGLRERPEPTVYVPIPQSENILDCLLLVRAQLPPDSLLPAIRREVAALDPMVVFADPRTLRQRIDDSIFLERMIATLSGFFAGLTLLLAAVGLYGVMAYGVARRTGEIGIRMALGAATAGIRWMVLKEALVLVAAGITIGLPLSLAIGRLSSSLLFGIKPGDPMTLVVTAAVLLGTGMTAALLPACRASSIDPMQALRHE